MTHVVFDCELIGSIKPIFLVCTKELETGATNAFWFHKRGHMKQLTKMLLDSSYTWVGFNSYKFLSRSAGSSSGSVMQTRAPSVFGTMLPLPT